jgi:hypothetical protein
VVDLTALAIALAALVMAGRSRKVAEPLLIVLAGVLGVLLKGR